MTKDLTARYAIIQSFYWMGFATISGFASVYLLGMGFSNTQIGVIMAASGVASSVVQPIAATLAEGTGRTSLKSLLYSIGGLVTALGLTLVGLSLLGGPAVLTGLLYTGSLFLLQLAQPLINAAGTEALNHGQRLNWGLARGMGSAAYAAIACVLGVLTDRVGCVSVPAMIVFCFGGLTCSMLAFPFARSGAEKAGGGAATPLAFFKKYPRFAVLLIGAVLLFTGHTILNSFNYQIVQGKGGGSGEMGIAAALSACWELPTMFCFSLMVKRVRCDIWMRISGAFFTLKAASTWLAPNVPVFLGVQAFQVLGFGLIAVASVHYINAIMNREDAIKGQAYFTMTTTLGTVLGALTGGAMLDRFGVGTLLACISAVSLAGALILSAAAQPTPLEETR